MKNVGNNFGFRHGWCSRANPSPEYRAWSAIKSRCLNPKVKCFERYGGRGIRICDRWRYSFANFMADVGPRPSPQHTIERTDNDGHYEPGNVIWALRIDQQNNRRNTIFVSLRGERIPLAEACRILNLDHNAVWMRIDRGMSPEAAIAVPLRKYRS
jgi:hypothetical protein